MVSYCIWSWGFCIKWCQSFEMSCVTIFRATASLWEVQHHRDSWTLMLPCWVSNGVIRDVVHDIAWPFFRARHSLPGWANSGTARRVWTSERGRHQGFGLHTSERTSMKILWVDLVIWCLFFSPVDGWRWWILYDFVGLMILVCLLMHTCYHVSMVRDGSGGWVWWCHVGCHAWPFFRESMWINWNHIFVIFCVVLGVHHCTDCQDDQVQEQPSGSGPPKVAGVMDENTFKPFLTSAANDASVVRAGWLQIFLARGSSIEILRPHSWPF